jgi:cobalt-zinc-cadmium efflux system membrane fusion protein
VTPDIQPPIFKKGIRSARSIALVLVAVIAAAATALLWRPLADQPENVRSTQSTEPPGTFRPTQQQWRSLKLEPVTLRAFRPQQVTEGTIAVDDDLTTPVFSHYSGRVTKVIAMLGDVVEPGAPLFVISASEFVQAQNDLITALANLQSARSQLKMAQTTEKRTHDLYQAQGGSLKDWQQAQTDLITAQNTVRADEIALHAVRRRLRILGKTDEEIASLEEQPTQKFEPTATVTAPVRGTITQRQLGVGQYINSEAAGATNPVYTISDLSTVYLIANVREVDAPLIKVGLPLECMCWPIPTASSKGKCPTSRRRLIRIHTASRFVPMSKTPTGP